MKKQTYIVSFSGLHPCQIVKYRVKASNADNARGTALELAKKEGEPIKECLRVELARETGAESMKRLMVNYLWDQCDLTAGQTGMDRINFVLCANIAAALGNRYWKNSVDY